MALSGTVALAASAIGAASGLGEDPQRGGAEQHVATHQIMTGGAITYKTVVTNTEAQTTSSTSYAFLPLAGLRVPILAGRTALINVRFAAESRCSEVDGAGELNYCEVRILIGGVEGFPRNSSTASRLAFDSTNNGADGVGSWESHATESHRCVRNPGTTTMFVPVQVQWRVTNFGADLDTPEFWLDDWSLVGERSENCSPVDPTPSPA